jgi:hypothetical protein
MLERKWEYNRTVDVLLIDFGKAYNSGQEYYAMFSVNLAYL